MQIPPAEIEIWTLSLDDFPWNPSLHPSEERQAAAILDAAQRLRYERSRTAMRHVLAERLSADPKAIDIRLSPKGKPFTNGCEFSISHSGAWFAMALSDRPVGIDIEILRPRRQILELARRFFSARDYRVLAEMAGTHVDRAFHRQWVAKEAALKAAGVGIAHHLHKAECTYEGEAIRDVGWEGESFAIHEFKLPDDTPGAIARHGGGDALIRWRQPALATIR